MSCQTGGHGWISWAPPPIDGGQRRAPEPGSARGIRCSCITSWVVQLEVGFEFLEGVVAGGSDSWEGDAWWVVEGWLGEKRESSEGVSRGNL